MHASDINPFRDILADLSTLQADSVTFSVQRPPAGQEIDGEWVLTVGANGRTETLTRSGAEGLRLGPLNGSPSADDMRWLPHWHTSAILAVRLGCKLLPQRGYGGPWPPREPLTPLRARLLPLARLVGGNTYTHAQPAGDPHYAMRLIDGLYDQDVHVLGALDGLEMAVEGGCWELTQLAEMEDQEPVQAETE